MANVSRGMEDAIQIAIEAEKSAAEFYADAAAKAENVGRTLFIQLEAFEWHHFNQLTELQKSLAENGSFIKYDDTVPTIESGDKAKLSEELKMSLMEIVALALENEAKAKVAYDDLANQTDDPAGKAMFQQLADEEDHHHGILKSAYWSLNQTGEWRWQD
jgi:rubrerythrin